MLSVREAKEEKTLAIASGESGDDFQSAEDILDSVMATAGCADFFNSRTPFLETHFDEPEPEPEPEPPILDPDAVSNFAIDLQLPERNQSAQFCMRNLPDNTGSSLDSGSTCRTPSEHKNVTFNPQVVNIESPIRSPELKPRKSERWHLLPLRRNKKEIKEKEQLQQPKQPKQVKPQQQQLLHFRHGQQKTDPVPKTILCSSKRRNSEDEFFSRTEALPLLSGLAGVNAEKTSPNFVRRKKYVYPAVTVINKSESSV